MSLVGLVDNFTAVQLEDKSRSHHGFVSQEDLATDSFALTSITLEHLLGIDIYFGGIQGFAALMRNHPFNFVPFETILLGELVWPPKRQKTPSGR